MFVHVKTGRFFETSKEVKSKQTIETALRHRQVGDGWWVVGGGNAVSVFFVTVTGILETLDW